MDPRSIYKQALSTGGPDELSAAVDYLRTVASNSRMYAEAPLTRDTTIAGGYLKLAEEAVKYSEKANEQKNRIVRLD